MDVATGLDLALRRAEIPIVGVSVATANDRSTWVVTYADDATAEQRDAGEALRDTYTVEGDTDAVAEQIAQSLNTLDYVVLIAYLAQMQSTTEAAVRADLAAIALAKRQELGL